MHAYVHGTGRHLTAAVGLLQHYTEQVWAFAEEQAHPQTPPQEDDWEVLDMRKYCVRGSEKIWFSVADAGVWFVPDSSGAQSTCSTWQAYHDARADIWWCNEIDKQLYFPAAAWRCVLVCFPLAGRLNGVSRRQEVKV